MLLHNINFLSLLTICNHVNVGVVFSGKPEMLMGDTYKIWKQIG